MVRSVLQYMPRWQSLTPSSYLDPSPTPDCTNRPSASHFGPSLERPQAPDSERHSPSRPNEYHQDRCGRVQTLSVADWNPLRAASKVKGKRRGGESATNRSATRNTNRYRRWILTTKLKVSTDPQGLYYIPLVAELERGRESGTKTQRRFCPKSYPRTASFVDHPDCVL